MSAPKGISEKDVKSYSHQDEENNVSVSAAEMYTVNRGRGELQIDDLRNSIPILKQLNQVEAWMDRKFGVETTGADRVLEDERDPPNVLNMMLLWWSMLISPGNLTMGILGPILGLSVYDSIVISIFGNILGSIIPSFTATLCPSTGLRQIAVCRYAFGIWGSKFCGLLNAVINVGFGTINCIVAGQLIRAVSGGHVTMVAGIVIVAVGSYIISFFGFKVVHRYEQVAWVLILIFMCIQYGQSSRYWSQTPNVSQVSGIDRTGAALSYFAIIFGESAAWCSMSGDYYVHYPADVSRWLVFGMTMAGLIVPSIFGFVLGNLYGGIILTDQRLSGIYDEQGIGGLILYTMRPMAWSKFVCVLYALSFMGNVTAIYYSSSLSLQLWGRYFMAIPRFVWNTLLAAISLGLAWGGRNSLEAIIGDFLDLLGYWTICFGVILAIEHFYFRPRIGGYDLEGWQDSDRVPLGIAGCFTLALGIGVSFIGMNQTWFTGPAAKAIGKGGGDVGDYITLVAVTISYPIARHLEIRYTGR